MSDKNPIVVHYMVKKLIGSYISKEENTYHLYVLCMPKRKHNIWGVICHNDWKKVTCKRCMNAK